MNTKKNSLTQFKKPNTPILPTERPVSAETPQAPGKRGPKPKSAAEKQSHRVMLSLTPSEVAILNQKRGVANEATYIRAFLIENGFFK